METKSLLEQKVDEVASLEVALSKEKEANVTLQKSLEVKAEETAYEAPVNKRKRLRQ
jgi:hypothetical protein